MQIHIYCPKCRGFLQVGEELLGEVVRCQHCGHEFKARDGFDFESTERMTSTANYAERMGTKPALAQYGRPAGREKKKRGAPVLAVILALIGISGAAYFTLFFNVGVSANGVTVANSGLMSQRTIEVIVSIGIFLAGIIMAVVGASRRQ